MQTVDFLLFILHLDNCAISVYNTDSKRKEKVMGPRFDETNRGRRFYDSDLPRLIRAIEENTKELKRANDLKEQELKKDNKEG